MSDTPTTESEQTPGVAIVGMAGRFPGAADVRAFWEALCAGRESISFFTEDELDPSIPAEERADPKYVRARGVLDEADKFDAAFFGINSRQADLMDPQQRVFLELAWAAMEDAGQVPGHFGGMVGVYAGVGNNTYYPTSIHGRRRLIAAVGEFPTMLANEKDYVATRTAYHLNLTGPGISLNTACSTSLVAVIQGYYSLLSFQCDMALAGGVSIQVPQRSGYLCQEGDIYSTDGHCHPFDAAGNGTVFSNGGGVVVMRRVEDAVRDGDRIYAVIRGVGLNNDGMGKVSFGAPSVKGQAGAIAMALAQASIEPDAVSYIEAHGTGTQLGDPIEIEALTQAFREKTARRQFCAVGSVKGNVGHLTAASGVTGLIKTCLALQHRMLPPTINHDRPNPQIDFASSPFYVSRELKAWTSAGPRVAGVSSFGVGGTNAHVVLEEAPAVVPAAAATRPWQVLVLSAKTPAALTRAGANLRARLEGEPALNLADVAYTLQVGREAFPHRRYAVGRDAAEAAAALAGSDALRTGARHVEQRRPEVVFLFPGQGSQYVNMGRDLYAQEPVFREALDRCCDLLKPHLGLDLRETLYPAGDAAAAEEALAQTRLAQPAIFAMAYALAAQWRAWGVTPVAMIGHSIGEFVCGCLAGVFTLEDALMLVAARGRLMQAMPAGAMLSVRKPAAELEPLLGRDLSIAAINGPGLCVVSGPVEAVAALEARLEADGVRCKRLRTSHAFHSPMMDPVVPEFAAILRGVRLSAPQTPYLSTATARWITPEEATSPDYWARHLRATVRFADAVRALWQEHPQRVLLEVGPGTTAATLARQQAADPLKQVAVSSLGQSGQADDDAPALMRALGALWAAAVAVEWEQVHGGARRQRISLPTYPFERTRHWVEAMAPHGAGADDGSAGGEAAAIAAGDVKSDGGGDSKAALRHLLEEASGLDLAGAPDSATLLDMGFDSLSLTQLALSLRRAFGVDVTFRQLLEQYATLDALAAVVAAHKPAAAAKAVASPAGEERAVALEAAAPAAKAKTFGAGARIDLSAGQTLTPAQEESLQAFMDAYVRRTAGSKALTQQNRAHLADPRVVSGFRPRIKEIIYPIVVNRSEGSRLWDVDGNAYIDLTCGFGSNFFGNRAAFLVEAVKAQADRGFEIGPQHPLAGEVAGLFCELTGLERAAFCNTGSEAVLGAMRLARTVTGRLKIAIFAGAYHGILDEVIVRGGKAGKPLPAAPGIPPSAVENLLVLEYGSPAALETLKACAGELAAVLVEPVQSRRPGLQPREFLQALRAITAEAGAALIMDEVITGFRIHQGGAQAYFGVRGDLATYGKVVGGGMPIGVIGGSRRFMDALDGGHWQFGDDSFPTVGVTYFAGTFVRHPLTLAAARAALLHLKEGGPALQEGLNARTAAFTGALNAAFARRGMPLRVDHCGSLFKIMGSDDVPQGDLLYAWLRHHGLHLWDHRPCFLTLAHTDADLAEALAAFERALDAVQAAGFLQPAPAVVVMDPGDVPSTAAQREIWLSVRMGGRDANLAFNESVSVQVSGTLDLAVLRDAAQAAVDRHESLRATFSADGARMRIAETMAVAVATEDLSVLASDARAARLRAVMDAEVEEPFDLEHGPLIRFRLLKLSADEAQVVITAHHIVCDGWAIDVLVKDLGALYGARRRGVAAALPPADRFSAYAREREQFAESAEAAAVDGYWLERFAGDLPVLDLPADGARPTRRTFRGGRVDLALDEELVVTLRQAGARMGCSLVNLLLAGFDAWLYRVTGQTDLVVGLPAAGQSASGCEHLVGHCVNLLPLRATVEPAESFDALARRVRGVLLDAYEHQHFTFGRLLERLRLPRDPSRIPLLPVAFNIDQGIAVEGFSFDGRPTTFVSNPRHFENFELFLNAMPEGRTLVLQANHNADLYSRETVSAWLRSFVALLRAVARDATVAVAALPLLEADERRRVLVEWNATRSEYPRDMAIAKLFEEQAARTPSAVALVVAGASAEAGAAAVTVTYDALNRRANRLARVLVARGVKAEEPVGLAAERSAEAVVGLLAILKAGGAYLPLDPAWPRERLAFMLKDTEATLVLADESGARSLPPVSGGVLPLAATMDAPGVDDGNLPDAGGGERLAYLMYTSGSTGTPKGVAVTQRGVVRLVRGTNFMELDAGTAMLQFAPLAFDASTLEIWGPLLNGGRVVVAPPGVLTTAELGRVVRAQRVNALWLSAELFRLMVEERLEDLRGVRQLLAGGDVLAVSAVERVLEALPECRLINGYGPTENTTFTCCYDITRGRVTRPSVPIGRPVANTTAYLLDASLQPVPVGVPGELYTGGDGVARGYWRRPELTAAAFVADPFGEGEGGRLYRTGDRARYRPDGTIEFLGRRDRQLKLRGFRVEPGEIEAALERVEGIAQAVVSVWEPRPGDRRLAAHVVAAGGGRVSASTVREALRRSLPAHMIPQHVVELAAMPMTPTGKIDRARLPAPAEPGRGAAAVADEAPRGAMETRLSAVWCEVLGVARVRAVDNFFDLGGHSLLAIRAVERIRVATGVEVSPNDILFSTLRQLAATVEKAAV